MSTMNRILTAPRRRLSLAVLLLILLPTLALAADGATADRSWGVVKRSFHPDAPGGAPVAGIVVAGDATAKPLSLTPDGGIVLPDGRSISLAEILRQARAADPGLEVWRDPELQSLLAGERWWSEFVKWVKDHVKFAVGINSIGIQLITSEDTCIEIMYQYLGSPVVTVMPCM